KISEFGEISKDALLLIPRKIAEEHTMMPLSVEGGMLKIAMAVPSVEIRSAIKTLINMDVEAYIASEDEIRKAIAENY
ncbi:hypothetical protein ACFLTD_04450, partial [Elusimicrobiota bacterium]